MTANPNYRAAASRDIQHVLDRLHGVEPTSGGYQACCPAHEDNSPSLSISTGNDGRTLLYCHAGCAVDDIVAAIGMTMADLMGSAESSMGHVIPLPQKRAGTTYATMEDAAQAAARGVGKVETVHEYPSADGTVEFAVVRIMPANGKKTFRPVHRANGKWSIGDPKGLLPLFRLPSLAGKSEILVVEGEKCAEAAAALGFVATTSAHGAKSASKTDWSPLAGKNVFHSPDNDEAGRAYAKEVAEILGAHTPQATVCILQLPGLPAGGDIADWINAKRQAGLDDAEIAEDLSRCLEAALPATQTPSFADYAGIADGGSPPGWPSLQQLHREMVLPLFPIHTFFPAKLSWLKSYCLALAESLQVGVDAVVMTILPILALPLSKRFVVCPFAGWLEPLSIYTIVVLQSGERKSSIVSHLTAPIYEWQRRKAAAMVEEITRHENLYAVTKAKLDFARKKAASSETPSTDLDRLARQVHDLEAARPRRPQMIVTEATSEALTRVLAQNDERALLVAPEGDALDIMLGRYSKTPNMGIWLSAHAGDSVDCVRLGREPERLAKPALQIALSVQPDAIAALLASPAAEGRGLLARMLFSAPRTKMGHRPNHPPELPKQLLDQYRSCIQHHLEQPVPAEPQLIGLTTEAQQELDLFREQIEYDLREDGRLAHLRAWGSKAAGAILRIAGVLHAIEPTAGPDIDVETIRCAISVYPYLLAHYEHVMDLAGRDPAAALAHRIDAWLRRKQKCNFTLRDVANQFKGQTRKTEDMQPALDILIEAGRIRQVPGSKEQRPGRPRGPRYELNPGLIETRTPHPQYPHNPQNSPETNGGGS